MSKPPYNIAMPNGQDKTLTEELITFLHVIFYMTDVYVRLGVRGQRTSFRVTSASVNNDGRGVSFILHNK